MRSPTMMLRERGRPRGNATDRCHRPVMSVMCTASKILLGLTETVPHVKQLTAKHAPTQTHPYPPSGGIVSCGSLVTSSTCAACGFGQSERVRFVIWIQVSFEREEVI